MEMGSSDDGAIGDGDGGGDYYYETHIPLKDPAPSSPVPARSLDETSMNDLTVYEELPTFVDPNDCTWAADDSLIEETEANRVRHALALSPLSPSLPPPLPSLVRFTLTRHRIKLASTSQRRRGEARERR